MKVTTEKVNKIKAFEPFKLVIELDNIDDARQLKNEMYLFILERKPEIISLIHKMLSDELEKQGFI